MKRTEKKGRSSSERLAGVTGPTAAGRAKFAKYPRVPAGDTAGWLARSGGDDACPVG